MSLPGDIGVQNDALVRAVFRNDPTLLDDLKNHRCQDGHKLVRRLEAVKKQLSSVFAHSSDAAVPTLLATLVSVYIQTADSIRISRSVEKLWQPYASSHAEHIYAALEDQVLAIVSSQETDADSVGKVSALFEQSKLAQRVIRQHLASVVAWIAANLSPLLELSPLLLYQLQARRLYSFVKISLQLFQICPSEMALGIWSMDPVVCENQAFEQHGGEPALEELSSRSVRVIVEGLAQVLSDKGYHIDCVLLSGTAMALLLNTAPDPVTAAQSFTRLLGLTLGRGFNFECLVNTEVRSDDVRTEDMLSQLDRMTIENMGPIALIRGVVVCGNTDFLFCDEEEGSCEIPDCDVRDDKTTDISNKTEPFSVRTHSVFYRLFRYIQRLCQGDITLHYHAFHILLLWYTRINKFTSVKESCVQTLAPSVLESTLELVMLNWDSPVEDVPDIVVDIFSNMMSLWASVKARMSEFSSSILDVLLKAGWHVKGKYRVLAVLLKYLDPQQVFQVCTGIQPQLLRCLATNHLAPSASAVYRAFLTELGNNSGKAVERWSSIWLQTVETGLVSENVLLRHNTGLYWVPATVRLVPGSASCLQGHLSMKLGSSASAGTHVSRTRLLHAWVVVASAIRSLTGTADLTDHHIKEALYSLDEDIRSEAIALVCTTLKKAECISDMEASLLKESLPHNVKVDSAPFRQLLGSNLRKLLIRLRDSCITLLKAPQENKQKLDCALDFVDWLHNLCMSYLMPGACYQRRKGSLDLLHVIYECLMYCPDGRTRKGFTPETAVKLVDFAVTTGRWLFFCRPNVDALILCLLDGADEIQTSAFQLLNRYYPWPLEENVEAPDSLCCPLVATALQLCTSPKGHESQSGAVLCKLAFQKYVLLRNVHITFSLGTGGNRYDVNANCSHGNKASQFLRLLHQEIQMSLNKAEKNLVIASKKFPVHGLVAAACQCMTDSDGVWAGEDNSETVAVALEFVTTCQTIVDKMLNIMSSVAGQEACPSFAEIGMALESLLLEHQPEYTESTALSPEYQYLLSWCWNNIKESCTSLAEVLRTMVANKVATPTQLVQGLNSTFLAVLTKCRHKGVIEGCRSAFVQFCSALFTSEDESLHKIPEETLNQVLSSLKSKEMKSSVTRRSAGLPIILQAILTSEKKLKKKVLLTVAVAGLFEVCDLPLDQDPGLMDLPQVHGLNILNSLFGDTSLSCSLMGHVSRALALVIRQFGSPSWAIRNAATRFFSTLVTKVFGQKKTGGDEGNMLCNSVTFVEFSSYYPDLPPFLLGLLREASMKDVANIAEIHPCLFPALTMLSFLKPVDKSDEGLKSSLAEFGSLIKTFVHSPVYQLRHLVAPAFVAMVTTADLGTTAVTILQEHIPKDGSKKNLSWNSIHGNLLVINKLLDNITDEDRVESVWTLLTERSWLLSAQQGMVAALYVTLLQRMMTQHGRLAPQSGLIDKIMHICCHGDALVGDGMLKSGLVELLFKTASQKGHSDLLALIGQLLASDSLETRKAALSTVETQLSDGGSWRRNLLGVLCKNLKSEIYTTNLCVMLNMISRLYLEFSTMLPEDLDHIRDWFKNYLPVQRKCVSLQAASVPVQGILIKDILQRDTGSSSDNHAGSVCVWCEAVRDSSQATNETRRHAAALALQVAGGTVFKAGKEDTADWSNCVISLMSACLTLIQDEDTEIRAEACKFVASLEWPERQVQYHSLHSNVCFELFLQYIATQFWQSPACTRCLCSQLYRRGNLATVLEDKKITRYQQLFDQEDNSFFAERLYNAVSFHRTLKVMVARGSSSGRDTVSKTILESGDIMQDIDALNETLQSVKAGSVINICCDSIVLGSIGGLLLMADLVSLVTCDSEKQAIRSKLNGIFQEQKLPPGVGSVFGNACDQFS